MNLSNFQRFKQFLIDERPPNDRDERLLMEQAGGTTVYYAPFEFVNPAARITLVGITPGPTQMLNACSAARSALLAGANDADALRQAKLTGAFSGEPMRSNLVRQMNHWGIPRWLGLQDSAELFGSAARLLQTTSLLRYPVFQDGKPYAGNPNMMRHPMLRKYLHEHFGREFDAAPGALFVSLGPTVQSVLQDLIDEGQIDRRRVVLGMLHPSGNCTYRINYLVGPRTGPAPHATNVASYDRGLAAFWAAHVESSK